MGRKKKQKIKKFKIVHEYSLDDLIYDPNDADEIEYATPYVGKYILRRMTFGDQRASEAGLIQIKTKVKGKDISIDDVVPDVSHWQEDILAFSLYKCPFGERPKGGWLKGDIESLRDFIYELPEKIGQKLLEESMRMNDLSEEDSKN